MNFRRTLPEIRCLLQWAFRPRNFMKNRAAALTVHMVGRPPWSGCPLGQDALVPLPGQRYQHHAERQQADGGVGRGPGGPPHHSPRVVFRPVPELAPLDTLARSLCPQKRLSTRTRRRSKALGIVGPDL